MSVRSLRSSRVLRPSSDGRGPTLGPATIFVEQGRIVRVVDAQAECDEDFGDRLITPAFVNAHTHLALAFARGLPVPDAGSANRVEELFFALERRLTREQVLAFARMGAYESLLAGVGFVWDHYYYADAVAQALAETGLCGAVAPTLQDLAGPGADAWEDALALTESLADDRDAADRGIVAALGPHATDTVSDSLWAAIGELAHRKSLPVHFHLGQSLEEVERAHAQASTTPLGRIRAAGVLDWDVPLVMAHAIFVGDAELAALDPQRHCLVWCPRSASFFAFPAQPGRWESAGATWVVASDAAASNDRMDPRAELFEVHRQRTGPVTESSQYEGYLRSPSVAAARSTWERRAQRWAESESWASPLQLLRRVLELPGALHPQVRAGAIEAGALANLVVWEDLGPEAWPATDPVHALCFSTPGAGLAIHNLMTLGQWRGEAGNFRQSLLKGTPYREARAEADARYAELMDAR